MRAARGTGILPVSSENSRARRPCHSNPPLPHSPVSVVNSRSPRLHFVAALVLGSIIPHAASAKSYRLTLAATDADRSGQVIAFTLPADAPKPAEIRDAEGRSIPLQVDANGTARFVVAAQKAGETKVLTLVPARDSARAIVSAVSASGALTVSIAAKPVLTYRTDKEALPRADIDPKFKRAGYLHPLFSPAGKIVTGDYPSNHVHHHGIWTAWSKTQFDGRAPNFWEMAESKGTVEFIAIDRTWSGAVHGGFVSRQRFIDLTAPPPTVALNETWEITAYDMSGAPQPVRVFDLTITQTCATPQPLVLPKFLYGGLGLRGRDEWNGKATLTVLTSESETTRAKANSTRPRWTYLGGAVEDGAHAGLTVLGHPENFRAPQPIRVHPDMPFLSVAPTQLGDITISPGSPYVARYRFVITDGAPNSADCEALWNGYAHAAVPKLEPL